ncbi:hypothetical protein Tco_0673989 [Tanacetum coccineum]
MRRVGKGFSGRATTLFLTMVVQNQQEIGEGSAMPTDPQHSPTFIQPSTSQPQKTQKPRKLKKKDTQVPQSSVPSDNVADEAVYKELDDNLVRVATTSSILEAEQDSGNIIKTRSKATPNEAGSQGTTSGGGPKRQETMGDTIAQTRVLDLETTKTTQGNEIASLKIRVKKLERRNRRNSWVRALAELKSIKPKANRVLIQEPEQVGSKTASSRAREQFTIEQKATLFKELLEQRRKHFAAKRAKEKRNKPLTQSQQRKIMCTYLKNMVGKKPKDLKNKSFDYIQKMFDRDFKRVNTFVKFRTDLVEGSLKRAGDELEQEVTKKQKVDDVQETTEVDNDQEAAKIKELMKIVSDEEEVAIDAIPLATKPPTIVDWKIHKEGKKNYYQIIRADGSSKMYLVFSHMLKSFDMEDFKTLCKLVKAKYGSTRPVEDLYLILWGRIF